MTFLLLRCSNPKRNLIVVENDYEIDLTELDSVRENLNGFWIPENHLDSENILLLDFYKKKKKLRLGKQSHLLKKLNELNHYQ